MTEYVTSGFVTRDGTTLKRFQLKANVGNETISALTRIFLEAVLDAATNMPALKNGKGVYLATGNTTQPTAAKLEIVDTIETIAKDSSERCGITELEFDTIQRTASLDSDYAGLVSKTLLEMFGNFEISFVIGAEIKFGDANTVTAVVQTAAETLARRVREAALLEFFHHLSITYKSGRESFGRRNDRLVAAAASDVIRAGRARLVDPKVDQTTGRESFAAPIAPRRRNSRSDGEIEFLTAVVGSFQ